MRYFGGKNGAGVYQRIINQIPLHVLYIEPFVGSGAILRRKRPAAASIAIDRDPGAIARLRGEVLPGCSLIVGDALEWLKLLAPTFPPQTFIYCDPPYLFGTRRSKHRYPYDFGSPANHRALLWILTGLRCQVMLSGYPSNLYREYLGAWRLDRFEVMTSGGKPATECLWMNYPEATELHDYRYLGSNFREREKFTRQRRRWVARLARMDRFQRLALAAAIAGPDPHAGNGAAAGGSDKHDDGSGSLLGSGNLVASPLAASPADHALVGDGRRGSADPTGLPLSSTLAMEALHAGNRGEDRPASPDDSRGHRRKQRADPGQEGKSHEFVG